MKSIRFIPVVAVIALAACTPPVEGVSRYYSVPCMVKGAKQASTAKWDQAETIDITIQDGEFNPRSIYLKVGDPAILRFANKDGVDRFFSDNGFLRTSAVAQVSIGGFDHTKPCVNGLRIGPRKTAEVRLVPLNAGRYYFQDSWIVYPALLAEISIRGGDGFITVRP